MKPFRTSVAGFTLVELLIVITIASILAAIALPSFKSLNESQRVKNAAYEIYSVLNLARSEAIKRNKNITVTPSPSWTALASINVADGGVTLVDRPTPKGIKITASASATSGITYQHNGRTSITAAPITFQLDVAGAATPTRNVRCITIELSGMPRTRMGACP